MLGALPTTAMLVVAVLGAAVLPAACGGGTTPDASPAATGAGAFLPPDGPSPATQGSHDGASPRPAVSYAEPPEPGRLGGCFGLGTNGWEFTPAVDIEVTALGYFDAYQNGLLRTRRVGIFDGTDDRLIASVTVGRESILDGAFRWEPLGMPVVLEAGRSYLAGSEYARGDGLYDPTGDEVWAPEIMPGGLLSSPSGFVAPHEDKPWLCFMGPNFAFRPLSGASSP